MKALQNSQEVEQAFRPDTGSHGKQVSLVSNISITTNNFCYRNSATVSEFVCLSKTCILHMIYPLLLRDRQVYDEGEQKRDPFSIKRLKCTTLMDAAVALPTSQFDEATQGTRQIHIKDPIKFAHRKQHFKQPPWQRLTCANPGNVECAKSISRNRIASSAVESAASASKAKSKEEEKKR